MNVKFQDLLKEENLENACIETKALYTFYFD